MPNGVGIQLTMTSSSDLSEKPIRRFIGSYPLLFGALIGVVIVPAIISIETWFPSVSVGWDRHNRLIQSCWFTAGIFGVWIWRYWNYRHRTSFWVAMFVFFLFHVL